MKKYIQGGALVLIISCFSALAFAVSDVQKYDGREHSCEFLQTKLHEDGIIHVRGFLGGNDHVINRSYCAADETLSSAYTASKDKWFCQLGYICTKKPMDGG